MEKSNSKIPEWAIKIIAQHYLGKAQRDEQESDNKDFFNKMDNDTQYRDYDREIYSTGKALFLGAKLQGAIDTVLKDYFVNDLVDCKITKIRKEKDCYIVTLPWSRKFLYYCGKQYIVINEEEAKSYAGNCYYYWDSQKIHEYYNVKVHFTKTTDDIHLISFNRLTPQLISIDGNPINPVLSCEIKKEVPLLERNTYTVYSILGENVQKCIPKLRSIGLDLYYNIEFNQNKVTVKLNDSIYSSSTYELTELANILKKAQELSTVHNNTLVYNPNSITMAVKNDNYVNTASTSATFKLPTTATCCCSNDTSAIAAGVIFPTTTTPVNYNFNGTPNTTFIMTMDKEEKKENKNMFKFDFGTCENMNLRMSPYGLAIKKSDGWVSYDSKSETIIDVDIFAFDCGKYIMRMPVPVSSVAEGDMIMHNGSPVYVTAVNKKSFEVIDPLHGEEKTIKATMSPFGFNFITKVIPLFNAFNSTEASDENPFGNMLPFMLMSQDGGNIDPMVMAMMFMNGNGAASDNNMMKFLPFALMSQNGNNKSDYLPYIMMMGMNNIG